MLQMLLLRHVVMEPSSSYRRLYLPEALDALQRGEVNG